MEGSGLGLAIVKEIIELHGGRVGLSSKENQHTFWFTVPLSLTD
ncbi:MAG: ATP-binding protein [Clostridiaceae bacterium]|nr:ATP-binding protein [Clostridiaceae bacterium]